MSKFQFQSTHPLRGATSACRQSGTCTIFQSTHPLRGATRRQHHHLQQKRFQSTHPLRGATMDADIAGCVGGISIHAPLAGCDRSSSSATASASDFNPRTPCGVRQQNCRNIPGKFAQKLQNFCKAEQRAALPRVGQRESGCYFRPCAVRTSRGKPEHFRFASDNERALRSVARLCAEVLDAGFILVSKVIKA